MGLYRTYDLDSVLGGWILQTFAGKETTFGDDRHLTNRILSLGLQARYTHRTYCLSESPNEFVRWIKQQTRWSKSFFREAFWFPCVFAYHHIWLAVETVKQSLYPFILIGTVFHFLYGPVTDVWRPVTWLATLFGVALVKSIVGFCVEHDPYLLMFTFYGVFYFFGLLPSVSYSLSSDRTSANPHSATENLGYPNRCANSLGYFSSLID
jgi:hyaluronan synthase